MRVAILSDVHGNLLALEAVLQDITAIGGADAVIVAGDLCLDGPQPHETLARLRMLGYPMVQGNTDRDLALSPSETAMSEAAALLDWTRERLGEEALAFLRSLPFDHVVEDPTGAPSLRIVHANPQNLDEHLQPYSPDAKIAPLLAKLPSEVRVLVFGHLHLPFVREFGGVTLVNVASVGLPKDGDRRANYGLLRWDGDRWAVEQRRVEYPVDEAVEQLREADPPGADELIKVLLRARYPNLTVARGGRPPKRRIPARPAAVHAPSDSEGLTTAIGTDDGMPPADQGGDVNRGDAGARGAAAGEPIAVVAPRGKAAEGATPVKDADKVEPSAGLSEDAADVTSADAAVTSDAELAETTVLPDAPPAGVDEVADGADGDQVAASDEVITEDAALAYSEEEAVVAGDDASGASSGLGGPDNIDEVYTRAAVDPAVEVALDASAEDFGTVASGITAENSDAADPTAAVEDTDDGDETVVEDDAASAEAPPREAGAGATKAEKKHRKHARKAAKKAAAAGMPGLSADESFVDALPALLESRLSIVLAQLPGVRADDDPEAVHDMRVATRRLRAALVPAEQFYGQKTYRQLMRPVRDLARALGRVRDADVLLAYLRERYMAVANEERAGIESLIDLIASDRASARDDLDPVLDDWDEDGDRAATFVELAMKVKKPRKNKARVLVGDVAARALERDTALFEERAALLADEGGSAEDFHDLRIAGKKLRYTLELFAPTFGEATDELLASLRSLQEVLGEIHDRDVLADLLAWERARTLERQLHSLEYATFNPGTREERLRAARQLLDAPDSFGATAVGAYGLLIDATIERDALEERLRQEWDSGMVEQFLTRLAQLANSQSGDDDSNVDEPDDAAGEAPAALADAD